MYRHNELRFDVALGGKKGKSSASRMAGFRRLVGDGKSRHIKPQNINCSLHSSYFTNFYESICFVIDKRLEQFAFL